MQLKMLLSLFVSPSVLPFSKLDDSFFLALSFHAVAGWQVTVFRSLLLFSVFFCSCTCCRLFCSSSASFISFFKCLCEYQSGSGQKGPCSGRWCFLWQWRTSLLSSCFACYSSSSCYPFAYRLSPACSHHLQPVIMRVMLWRVV
jgi:hypothetical protein